MTTSLQHHLAQAAEPVRDQHAAAVTAAEFLRDAGTLTLDERRRLVDQALVLLQDSYVHCGSRSRMKVLTG